MISDRRCCLIPLQHPPGPRPKNLRPTCTIIMVRQIPGRRDTYRAVYPGTSHLTRVPTRVYSTFSPTEGLQQRVADFTGQGHVDSETDGTRLMTKTLYVC